MRSLGIRPPTGLSSVLKSLVCLKITVESRNCPNIHQGNDSRQRLGLVEAHGGGKAPFPELLYEQIFWEARDFNTRDTAREQQPLSGSSQRARKYPTQGAQCND